MKRSVFRFEIQVTADDRQERLDAVKRKLANIKGIDSVTAEVCHGVIKLALSATFDDREHAKRIHRKAVTTMMATLGVSIVSATTVLTDIF